MGKSYKTYAEAIKNCKSDEITIFDPNTGLYYNIKRFPRSNKEFWGLGSPW